MLHGYFAFAAIITDVEHRIQLICSPCNLQINQSIGTVLAYNDTMGTIQMLVLHWPMVPSTSAC